jgi:hypothetical protein
MKSEKKVFLILFVILLIPAVVFLLKPEINVQNKFIKFSWNEGMRDVRSAIEKKNPKELTDKIYGKLDIIFKNTVLNQKVDIIYTDYLNYTRNKAKKFLDKCKTFIS